MKIAIHQPNFIPWLPFFYKMAMVDHFVLWDQVQFEKNGFQNRAKIFDKWWTKPVHQKLNETIFCKDYVGLETNVENPMYRWAGGSVVNLNTKWIETIKQTLNIEARVHSMSPRAKDLESLSPTEKLIEVIKWVKSGFKIKEEMVYVTNPEAKNKYLDEELMRSNGIEIEYCKVPRHLNRHVFEMFDEFGIEKTISQLPKKKVEQNPEYANKLSHPHLFPDTSREYEYEKHPTIL